MPISQNLWVKPGAADGATTYVSFLYPIINLDAVDLVHNLYAGQLYIWLPGDVDLTHALVSGVLEQPLKSYNLWPAEAADITHAFLSGDIVTVLKTYNLWPPENVDIVHAFVDGTLTTILFSYLNWPVENVDMSHAFVSGTLS